MTALTLNPKSLGIIAIICYLAACGPQGEIGDVVEETGEETTRSTTSHHFDFEVRPTTGAAVVDATVCNRSRIQVRVVDPGTRSCSKPRVFMVYRGSAYPSRSVSFNTWTTFDVSRFSGRFELRASCGSDSKARTMYNDRSRPRFSRVYANSSTGYWAKSPTRLSAGGVYDDGYWRASEYRNELTVVPAAGGVTITRSGPSTGTTVTLAEGRYTATLRIIDGCGRRSAARTKTFAVDARRPTVSFSKPSAYAMVHRGSKLKIEVIAGDLVSPTAGMAGTSGLSNVKIYLDNIPGEFTSGRLLCTLNGPWINGFANKKSCTVGASWTRGSHKLIAVAKDRAGNDRRTERRVTVW